MPVRSRRHRIRASCSSRSSTTSKRPEGMDVLRCGCAILAAALLGSGATAQDRASTTADLPIVGLAGITFRVSDLDRARRYYQGVLGFPEAFALKDTSGRTASAFFKINDDQYVEVVPGLPLGSINRQVRVVFQSSNLQRLRDIYAERGLNPTAIAQGADGNPVFRVLGPDDAML